MTAKSRGDSWRRGEDYYAEGALLWLEADLRIRELSGDRKSLDDFARDLFRGLAQGEHHHCAGCHRGEPRNEDDAQRAH